jgi:hypothetical protein
MQFGLLGVRSGSTVRPVHYTTPSARYLAIVASS